MRSLSPVTKRNILKVTAKLFDPLGITSPIIIKNKILFQNFLNMIGMSQLIKLFKGTGSNGFQNYVR